MTSNGCGSGALRKYVPQLSFGHCCDMHDYCYDNCASGRVEKCTEPYCSPGQFERCNSVFYDCMHETVCERIPWYHPIDRVNCEAAAVFYTGVVMTSLGGDAFKDATKQRCGAYCRSGAPFCGMGEDGAGGSCASTTDNSNCGECGQECDTGRGFACRGSKCVCTADVFNDSSNCGACGNKCPFGTKCSRGSCVCAADTCGNLCVNKQRHPRNCGSCGTVCATGICWDGVCKRPEDLPTPSGSAPTCLPTDAVKNGGFNGIPLLGASVPPSPWSIGDSKFGGIDARRVGPLSFVSLHTSGTTSPTDGIAFVQLVQDITMCPGKAYELTGTISMGNKGNLRIAVGNKVIFNKFYDDAPFQNRALGPLPFTAPASDDTFVSVRLVFYLDNNLIPIRFGLAVPQSATNLVLDDVSIYQP
ncbi:hypothetical protein Micbo1qcDRAFT_167891 [Microdochium bolleyi]|uniref:Uncharacterized protein n=1 Tax=Microdochium bolleyi TaxID=196109 RepID=A0A136IPD9_9PEZI|nr:hypothetical protein Micbo1qcDRAFT_167891 [Microdochium bolleyi]